MFVLNVAEAKCSFLPLLAEVVQSRNFPNAPHQPRAKLSPEQMAMLCLGLYPLSPCTHTPFNVHMGS